MGVPLFDLIADPLSEGLTNDGRTHVGNPLLGDLGHIFLVRKVFFNTLLLDGEGQDLGDRKVLVLRDVDGLDLFVGKIGLLPANDIFQKIDCDVICKKLRVRTWRAVDLPYGGMYTLQSVARNV